MTLANSDFLGTEFRSGGATAAEQRALISLKLPRRTKRFTNPYVPDALKRVRPLQPVYARILKKIANASKAAATFDNGPRLSPMSWVQSVPHVSGMDLQFSRRPPANSPLTPSRKLGQAEAKEAAD